MSNLNSRKGFALPLVLGITLMITILVMGISDSVSRKINVATELVHHTQARFKAISGFNQAVYALLMATYTPTGILIHSVPGAGVAEAGTDLLSPEFENQTFWNLYGSPIELSPGLHVALQDTAGMVSPLYSSSMLARLVAQGTSDPDLPVRAMDTLNDWQDKDDFMRLNGAEAWHYRSANLPYTPRNAYMQSLSELKLIKHFSADLVDSMAEHLIYWPSANTNYLTMSPGLIKMVIKDETLADHILELREQRMLSPALFTALTGIRPEEETSFFPSGRTQITVTAQVETVRTRIRAVVSGQPSGDKPFTIFLWGY